MKDKAMDINTGRGEAKSSLRALVEALPLPVFTLDAKGNVRLWNAAAERTFGWSEDEVLGQPNPIVPADRQDEFYRLYRRALKGESFTGVQLRHQRRDGTPMVSSVSGAPFYNAHRRVTGILMVLVDLSERLQSAEAVHANEQYYRNLFENAHDIIFTCDLTGNFTSLNKAGEGISGYSRDEVLRMNLLQVVAPEQRALAEHSLQRAAKGEAPPDREWEMVARDGRRVPLEVSIQLIFQDGKPVAAQGIARDITERKRAEETLRATSQRLKYLLESTAVAIYTARTSGNYGPTSVTENVKELVGYEARELTEDSSFWIDHVHPEDRQRILTELPRLERGGFTHEYRFQHKDGTYRWMRDEMRLLTNECGSPVEIVGYWIDITERKRAQDALGESEQNYRELAESISDVFFAMDGDLKYTYWNKACEILTGIPAKDALGKSLYELFPDIRGARGESLYLEAIRTGQPHSIVHEYQVKGEDLIFELNAYPTHRGVCVIAKDITERKRAEKARRLSEERFQLVARATTDVVWDWDLGTNEVWWNEGVSSVLGYRREQVGGDVNWWYEHIHPQDRERVVSGIHAAIESGRQAWSDEYRHRRADGSYGYFFDRGYVIYDDTAKAVRMIGAMLDLSARKQAEEALRASEQRYRLLFERNLAGVCHTTVDGRILDCNEACARLFGYSSREEMLSRPAGELYHDPADREAFIARLKNQHELTNVESCLRRKDGTPVWVLENSTLLEGRDGAPAEIEGTLFDITERRQTEEEAKGSRDRLRSLAAHLQNVREEERAAIAREIHDELGQVLTALKTELCWLQRVRSEPREGAPPRPRPGGISSMLQLTDRAIDRVRNLATELRPPVLDELGLEAAIEWQANDFKNRTGIACEFSSSLEDIEIAPARSTAAFRIVQEALTNVARHAKATKVKINLRKQHNCLLLEVEDNGKGIAESDVHAPKSLGILGMHERALAFDGEVRLVGRKGKGTTVTVRIPMGHASGRSRAVRGATRSDLRSGRVTAKNRVRR